MDENVSPVRARRTSASACGRSQFERRAADEQGRPHPYGVEPAPLDHCEDRVTVEREQHERRAGDDRPQPLLVLAQRPLLASPFGNVPSVDDQLGSVPRAHPRLAYRLEHPPDAIPRPKPELRGLGDPGMVYRARQRLRDHRNVVRVDVVERVALEQIPGRVPQHAFHRRAGVAEHAVLAHDAIDPGGQDVRHSLEEMRVVDRELAGLRRVHPQDSEGAALAVHEDAQARDHALRRQQRRAAESSVRGQVLYHHRARRAEHKARMRVRIGRRHSSPDGAVTPTHPGAQQQRPAFRAQLEHAGERDFEHARHDGGGTRNELVRRSAGQRALADVGHRFLLARRGAQLRLRARQLGVANGVVLPQESEPARAHV